MIQALKFGTQMFTPCQVASLDEREGGLCITLVDRAIAHALIDVHEDSTIAALDGESHLEQIRILKSGEKHNLDARALFCFIGATPSTTWLPDAVARDARGFVLTNTDLTDGVARLPFESSMPGASAVASVHAWWARRAPNA